MVTVLYTRLIGKRVMDHIRNIWVLRRLLALVLLVLGIGVLINTLRSALPARRLARIIRWLLSASAVVLLL